MGPAANVSLTPAPAEFDTELWRRLDAMQLNQAGAGLTFTQRLARENRWTLRYAGRVVVEYRRFLYLTAAAGHAVCPSEDVDLAWHEHLTWTRHYWDDLCGQVLGYPLHHDPSGGGPRELWRHWEMYERTLASYERLFREPAPADIWPAPALRFARKRLPWRSRARLWLAAGGDHPHPL